MHHFFTIRCTFKVGGTCGYLNIVIYHCEKSYGLTKIIININNDSVKTAIIYPLSSLLFLFAPTVSLAPVEVANVASPRRRGSVDNLYYKRRDPYLCSIKALVLEGSGSRRMYPLKGTSVDRVCVVFGAPVDLGFFYYSSKTDSWWGAFAEGNSAPLKQRRLLL